MVCVFKQPFLVFKQYFTHFNTLYIFPQIFSNNNFQFLNTCTKQALSHSPTSLSRSVCYFLIYIYIHTGKFSLSLLVYAVLFFYIFKAKSFIYFCLLRSPLQLRHYSFFHFILLLLLFFFETHLFKLEDFLFCFFGFLSKTQFSVYICA